MNAPVIAAAVLTVYSSFAQAQLIHFLVSQWMSKSGEQMCKYDNGTILNVGINICPLSIK
jgi:hypothetical protein